MRFALPHIALYSGFSAPFDMYNLSKKLHESALELAKRRTSSIDCIHAHSGGTMEVAFGSILSEIATKFPETRAAITKMMVDQINAINNR